MLRLPSKQLPPTARRQLLQKKVRDLLSPRPKKKPKYLKGVYKGNYFRIPIQKSVKDAIPDVPKLPTRPVPEIFKSAPPVTQQIVAEEISVVTEKTFFERFQYWCLHNWAVLVLNFGSICTLVGFTRSDVLELRGCSMTGSLCYVVYNAAQLPRLMLPIAWSSLFASVNGYKILGILNERKGRVVLDETQEEIFVDYFMPHGLTPKQFEVLYQKAELVEKKQGELIIRQGETMGDIYLLFKGTTRASILGRHLTAASSGPARRSQQVGGDSGAWIGEMSFLENLFSKDHANNNKPENKAGSDETADAGEGKKVLASKVGTAGPRQLQSMYTIVAAEDCKLLKWSHQDMKDIMHRSNDFRSAMTRAMTAAIVGKVINFTVSKTTAIPTWSTWLDDWKHNAGAKVTVVESTAKADEEQGGEKVTV